MTPQPTAGSGTPASREGAKDPERGTPEAKAAPTKVGKKPGRRERRKARKAARSASGGASAAEAAPPMDEAQRRRARAAERQRAAAELKRARAAHRRGRVRQTRREESAREHRAAMLTMILTLGLLIAAVAVTGGMIASSMRTRPVTLAAPLHVYPVAQTTPGQCPTGTQGISAQAGTGPTCYHLNQGIAIRQVADLRVQRARSGNGYDVAVTLRTTDRKAFAQLTQAMVGRDLAFVVRERLVTAPRVEMPINDGKVAITGPQTRADADRIIRELRGR